MRLKRKFAVLIAVLALGCCFGPAASAAPWSAPLKIYTPETPGYGLVGVSCPTVSFCVAIDNENDVLTYDGNSWSDQVEVTGLFGPSPSAVSCPTVSFCAVADVNSHVTIYNGSSWGTPGGVDNKGHITDLSCSSASFCAAVDGNGYAVTYNGSSWKTPIHLGSGRLSSVSCSSASFCVAGSETGDVITWNGSSWNAPVTIFGPSGYLLGMSCLSASFCVTVTDHGSALAYNGSLWSAPVNVDGYSLSSVSCPSPTFCLSVDEEGSAPVFDGNEWSKFTSIDGNGGLTAVSCASPTFCAAVDYKGNALTYTGEPVPVNSNVPAINGNAIRGQTLTETHADWSHSPIEYIVQWELCDNTGVTCGPINGATSQSYVLTPADVGHRIRVMENAGNLTGTGIPVWSDSTTIVQEPAPKKVVKCAVPNVKGKTISQAKKLLSKNHCRLGKVTRRKHHGKHYAKYKVISQKPGPGRKLSAGSKVAIKLG